MPNLNELVARLRGEPFTDREKSLAFIDLVKQIYNHGKLRAIQGETNSHERWCELKDINWKKFERIFPPFGLPHLTSLKVGCEASDISQAVALKLQFEFKERSELTNLPIPAREIFDLRVNDAGKHSSYVKIWYFQVKNPDPDREGEGLDDLDDFLSLANFVKGTLDGKFGGRILPVNLTQTVNVK